MTVRPMAIADTAAHRERTGLDTALWLSALGWVVGTTTLFPLGNDALEAVSVLTFDRIALLLVAGLGAVVAARDRARWRGWGRVERSLALFCAIAALSWSTTLAGKSSVDFKRDVNLLLTGFVMPYAAFVLARHAGWTARQRMTSVRVIVAVIATVLVAIGLVQGLLDWRFLVAEANQDVHRSRVRGPFDNAVPYVFVLTVLVPVALAWYAHAARRRTRVLVALLCLGLVAGLILAQTRIVWVAVPVGLLYFAALSRSVRRPALLLAAALGAAIVASLMGIDHRLIGGPNSAAAAPRGGTATRMRDVEPLYHRVAVWGTALNMAVHRPLVGFGFGARTFVNAREGYYASCCGVSPAWAVPCHVPHNEILNVLVLMGGVGLLAYFAVLWALWRLLARHATRDDTFPRSVALAVQVALLMLAVCAQFHDVMYLTPLQILFFFLAGLAAPATGADAAWSGARAT